MIDLVVLLKRKLIKRKFLNKVSLSLHMNKTLNLIEIIEADCSLQTDF